MKSTIRFVATLIISATITAPAFAFAATSIYTDSNGGFQVNSVSGNSSFSFGNIGGGGVYSCGASSICSIASTVLYLINNVLVPVIFALAFIVFIYGIAKAYIFSGGDETARKKGHQLVLYGIIGFVVMLSLWGLVNVVSNTFGLAGYSAPALPMSY